jgi:hypothetical protein
MKFKSILITAVATISLATSTMAQVPNYVPTNGLVGWWPFNGNANDESGNGNNGTVNGPNLTSDRFGNFNSAFNFNSTSQNHINIPYNSSLTNWLGTLSLWLNTSSTFANEQRFLFGQPYGQPQLTINGNFCNNPNLGSIYFSNLNPPTDQGVCSNSQLNNGNWQHIVALYSLDSMKIFLNGIMQNAIVFNTPLNPNTCNASLGIGGYTTPAVCGFPQSAGQFFNGLIDDIGIWNRLLTQQEITDLYNAVNCANNTTITPQTNSLATGSTASYTAITSDPNPSYIWQSDLGQGFQTLNNFGNYSGANTSTLSIANVQLPNHTQPIRVITTSGNCIDTSNVAVINIIDTCITNITIYDTLLTAVTDTLIINAMITGINPPNNLNTLKVFPNPANTHITIDYGNFNTMSGYTLNIVSAVGQTVFTTPINQQISYIDLSTWTGNGIYFVQLIDPQNNTIENRKIVIQ